MSPVRYVLGVYIPEDDIFHSHCRESLKSYFLSLDHKLEMSGNICPPPKLHHNKMASSLYLYLQCSLYFVECNTAVCCS
jgi:hypothetical protein